MNTRCPGCGKEIDEELDICPHCKRDFTVAVKGTGRRVGSLDGSGIGPPKPKPEPAPPPAAPKSPAPTAKPRTKDGRSLPPQEAPAAPPPDDNLDDLPAFMKEALEDPPGNVSGASAGGAAGGPPPAGGDLDLPAHMLADINAPPSDMDDSILPPHMRGEAVAGFRTPAPTAKQANPMTYVLVAVALVGGFVISRVTAKKEPPKVEPAPFVKTVPPPEEEPGDDNSTGEGDDTATADEPVNDGDPVKPKLAFKTEDAPPIATESNGPADTKTGNKKRRAAPPQVQQTYIPPPEPKGPAHPKWRFRCEVLDLHTLQPIEGVKVILQDLGGSNAQFPAGTTGSQGSFRKSPPHSDAGYKVILRHPDYEAKFLPDTAHDFPSLEEDERKKIGKELKKFSVEMDPLLPDGEGFVNRKFYVLPREKHGMSLEDALDR